MKTTTILSSLALVLRAFAAPAPAATGSRESGTCPTTNGKILISNNNHNYKISCRRDFNTEVIGTTQTEVGIQGCLTACDGRIGCNAATFVATDDDQTIGFCYLRTKGKTHKAGSDTAVAVSVSSAPTATITTSPTATATSASITSASTSASTTSASSTAAAIPTSFAGLAIRSGSEIQYASINANGSFFWLFKETSSYCPSTISGCPDGNYTIFAGGNNTLALNVAVPGGQQVYVDNKGRLAFTVPHSANTGVESTVTGFDIVDNGLHLQFNGSDFAACPLGAAYGNAYQVYAAGSSAAQLDDTCLGFAFRISEAAGVGAFQYA